MKSGLTIAMELLESQPEEDFRKMATSRFFWLYSMCLFVPNSLRKILIWEAGAVIGSAAFYVALTPSTMPHFWTGAIVCTVVGSAIWLAYGWGVFLGASASLSNVRIRFKILFRIVRRKKSFEEVGLRELRRLFPEPAPPRADISLETFLRTERRARRVGIASLLLMFLFYAAWLTGAADSYVPLLKFAPPGSANAGWLWLVTFFGFLAPMVASLPITRRLAKRIRVEDRVEFARLLEERDPRTPTVLDIGPEGVIQMLESGAVTSYLVAKRVFRKIGFLSWWKVEDFPPVLILLPLISFLAGDLILRSAGLPISLVNVGLVAAPSVGLSLLLILAMIGTLLLTSSDSRMEAKAMMRALGSLDHAWVLSAEEKTELARAYREVTTEDSPDNHNINGVSVLQAAKPFGVIAAFFGSLFLAVYVGAIVYRAANFGLLDWLLILAFVAATVVTAASIALVRTTPSTKFLAEFQVFVAGKAFDESNQKTRWLSNKGEQRV